MGEETSNNDMAGEISTDLFLPIENPKDFPNSKEKSFKGTAMEIGMQPLLERRQQILDSGTEDEKARLQKAHIEAHQFVTTIVSYPDSANAATEALSVVFSDHEQATLVAQQEAQMAQERARAAEERARLAEVEAENIRLTLERTHIERALAKIAEAQAEIKAGAATSTAAELEQKVAETDQMIEELTRLAYEDSTTKLLNKRSFERDITQEIQKATESGQALSLIAIDGNGMKLINDTYSHLVGDKYIVKLAEKIKDGIRGTDLAFRFGGDEFMILLPGISPREAMEIAVRLNKAITDGLLEAVQEEIRKEIIKTEYQRRNGEDKDEKGKKKKPINTAILKRTAPLTISIGVHGINRGETITPTELWNDADAALYNAKEQSKLDSTDPTNRQGVVSLFLPGMQMPEEDEDESTGIDTTEAEAEAEALP